MLLHFPRAKWVWWWSPSLARLEWRRTSTCKTHFYRSTHYNPNRQLKICTGMNINWNTQINDMYTNEVRISFVATQVSFKNNCEGGCRALRTCPTLFYVLYAFLHLTLWNDFTKATKRKMNTVLLSKYIFPKIIYLKRSRDKVRGMNPCHGIWTTSSSLKKNLPTWTEKAISKV